MRAQKNLGPLGIRRQPGRQHLHRDFAVEHLVLGRPYDGHASAAEPPDEPVPAAQRLSDVHGLPFPAWDVLKRAT